MFEDDETLQMYIEESIEHLSDIESDLLAIEGTSGNTLDIDLVNNVFRAAHSIKGGAGFMGLTVVKELSHSLENVLDLIRNFEISPEPDKINVLLEGFDKLEELINNIQSSNDQDVESYITALEKITKASLLEEKQESVSEMLDIHLSDQRIFPGVSRYDIDNCKNDGKFIYIAEYDLIHDIHKKNKNPITLLKTLEKTGIIIDSRMDFESVGTLDSDLVSTRIPFQILYATIIEPDMAETLFGIEEQHIHLVEDHMLSLSSASGPSEALSMPARPLAEEEMSLAVDTDTSPAQAESTQLESVSPGSTDYEHAANPATSPQKPMHTNEHMNAESAEKDDMAASIKPQGSLRVNVNLLDTLMNLAGELVLSRNQLIQGIGSSNSKATELSSQRIDMITSELQEAIMRTRMQPIANVFNKFTRVVRDLSRDLGKEVDLIIEGKDVELDKTIIESINDPLTHLVRNAVDHGIEMPEKRKEAGKPPAGKIILRAFHDAGLVNIVISDDGKGLDPEKLARAALEKGLKTEQQISAMTDKEKTELILLPGFSTAQQVTDVSGRGVGMDVVVTNLEKLGGIIEIDSETGAGSDIQIKLPLTLAIIPSQIISVGNEKYAIPQVNLDELLRIPASMVKEKIEKVGDADVVRLRGNLLPLLNLSKILGIEKTFIHPDDNKKYPDKRVSVSDRRSLKHDTEETEPDSPADQGDKAKKQRTGKDRRYRAASAINIAVVSAGQFKYGMVVDELSDSEEIVVKPLGRHLKKGNGYAGATIMGDGRVALILDVSSLAQMAELTSASETEKITKAAREAREAEDRASDKASLLLFRNGESEYFAAPLNLVERIERIPVSSIEEISGKKVVQYRGGALPLYELSQVADLEKLPQREQQEIIVFKVKEREIGLIVSPPVDAVELFLDIDDSTLKQPCITGSMIINSHTTLLVDIFTLVKELNPSWFTQEKGAATEMAESGQKVILFAEDSAFFRNQVSSFMEEEGFKVIKAEDGAEAWEILQNRSEEIDIVVTDLEMPVMDGFELTKKIKDSPDFFNFSVIALTSLASDEHIKRGQLVGIDEYEIKLDRENLMKVIRKYLHV
ncbi:MAG: chemotaxis protein CheW [Thermodesulfobacteriota bacterium]|nr:chemotaxis protein CheW [Thermodesulfobacteriota bacterium]